MNLETNITSIKDEKVIEARSLLTSKGRLEARKFLLEGEEQIAWSLSSPCRILYVFACDKLSNHPFVKNLQEKNIPVLLTTDGILKKITDTSYLIPFVGVARFPESKQRLKQDLIVVLDGVKDMGNIGTIIRTASAFGIQDFVSTDENCDFYYKKTIDASRGTVFDTALTRFKSGLDAIRYLKDKGFQVAVTTPHASVMQSFAQIEQKPLAIVFGNETTGASSEVMDQADIRIQIPMAGAIESLNVGVAAGISLYEMKIKLTLAMMTKKIQESLGRHLYCAARWIRLVFDSKLQESVPFNADQAILMMVLKCDGTSTWERLIHDAGISSTEDQGKLIDPLIREGYISDLNRELRLLEKGEEAIAKIWSIHELTENLVLEDVTVEEQRTFNKVLEKIQKNCAGITPFK